MIDFKFQSFETHIGLAMQFFSDNGLYGFCKVKTNDCRFRSKIDPELDANFFEKIPIRLESEEEIRVELDKLQENFSESPRKKLSYVSVELDGEFNLIENAIALANKQESIFSIQNSTLRLFWLDEVNRRATHKVDVELSSRQDKTGNTEDSDLSANDLTKNHLEDLFKQIEMSRSYHFDRNLPIKSVASVPINNYKLANFKHSSKQSVISMWKASAARFGEYARRKKWRDGLNRDVDSSEAEDLEEEEGFEVLNANRQRYKRKYMVDLTGKEKTIKHYFLEEEKKPDVVEESFDENSVLSMEVEEDKLEIEKELREINSEWKHSQNFFFEKSQRVDEESKYNYLTSSDQNEDLVVLSFREEPPDIDRASINYQM